MRINDEMAKTINEEYKKIKWHDDLDLRIGVCGENISKYHGSNGWEVCKLEELSKMIDALQKMKQAIETATGFVC